MNADRSLRLREATAYTLRAVAEGVKKKQYRKDRSINLGGGDSP